MAKPTKPPIATWILYPGFILSADRTKLYNEIAAEHKAGTITTREAYRRFTYHQISVAWWQNL